MSLLNVENRNKQLRLNHAFEIVKDKCPSYLKENNFVYVKDTTRANAYNFRVPICYGKGNVTFYYCAISDWNALPDTIKKIDNKHQFKLAVKNHLLCLAKTL